MNPGKQVVLAEGLARLAPWARPEQPGDRQQQQRPEKQPQERVDVLGDEHRDDYNDDQSENERDKGVDAVDWSLRMDL